MNKLFALLAALATFQVHADSLDTTPVVASVWLNGYGLREIALLDDARLQIVSANGTVETRQLAEATFQFLRVKASSLSGTELVTEKRDDICMFIKVPFSPSLSVTDFDFVEGGFTGERRKILTADHCGMPEFTHPKELAAHLQAYSLEEQLIALALEAAGEPTGF